jgi:uroporphyrinogen decarboxylase
MTRRERVLAALNFEETDRVPMDLGGMDSTGISCFAYPGLVAALGLPPRLPKVHDTGQMLALPDSDVLDALDSDVATVRLDLTNAYPQEDLWRRYDFNGRLPARVRFPERFEVREDGTIVQGNLTMPPAAHVFEAEHGGQPFSLTGEIPRPDIHALAAAMRESRLRDGDLKRVTAHCRRARESTDRAILFGGPPCHIGIGNHTGVALFPMLCLTEPNYVADLHETITTLLNEQIAELLDEIHPYIDLYHVTSDDWGTQNQCIASPQTYRDLFQPYYQRMNDTIHRHAPGVKTFMHSCGAIFDLLDDIIDSGFDVLNPVQWPAGGQGYRAWKDKTRGRIALWGGGVQTQSTLPLGTVEEVEREVAEVVSYLRQGGGYVFAAIHNILAEIPGDKVVALYRTVASLYRERPSP